MQTTKLLLMQTYSKVKTLQNSLKYCIFEKFFPKKNSPLKNLPFVSVLVKVSSCCSVSIAFYSYRDKQNLLKNKDGTFFCKETSC